jgi:hypothetical protein
MDGALRAYFGFETREKRVSRPDQRYIQPPPPKRLQISHDSFFWWTIAQNKCDTVDNETSLPRASRDELLPTSDSNLGRRDVG